MFKKSTILTVIIKFYSYGDQENISCIIQHWVTRRDAEKPIYIKERKLANVRPSKCKLISYDPITNL